MYRKWTLRYFLSHGPAQAKDFAWWSGLTLQEAQRGLEMSQGELLRETIAGKTYWRSPNGDGEQPGGPKALLLSIYDEYIIAHGDRSALDAERHIERLISMGSALSSVLILDGGIAGTWKRTLRKAQVAQLPGEEPKRLSYHFNRRLSTNFRRYINDRRPRAVSRDLLEKPDSSILDTAPVNGFNSKSSFNTLFIEAYGMTPREFKVECRGSGKIYENMKKTAKLRKKRFQHGESELTRFRWPLLFRWRGPLRILKNISSEEGLKRQRGQSPPRSRQGDRLLIQRSRVEPRQ